MWKLYCCAVAQDASIKRIHMMNGKQTQFDVMDRHCCFLMVWSETFERFFMQKKFFKDLKRSLYLCQAIHQLEIFQSG